VQPGDVLLTKDGANTGNAAINSLSEEFSLLSSVALIRCQSTRLHNGYLLQYLLSPMGQQRLKDMMAGNAITRLTLQKIKDFRVPIPPLEDQHVIAAVLDTADEAIAKTEAVIAKLKQVRAGLLHDLLTRGLDEHGQLRPSPTEAPQRYRDSPLGKIPREWEVGDLGARSLYATSGSRGWAKYYTDDGPLFLRIGNLTRDHINLCFDDVVCVRPPAGSEGARTRTQAGDILISITADLGIVGVVPCSLGEAYVNQHIALVRPSDEVVPRWLGHYLAAGPASRQFRLLNDSGAKAGLNLPAIESIRIALPEKAEQV
jgi:type I restriction enzyme S subunit